MPPHQLPPLESPAPTASPSLLNYLFPLEIHALLCQTFPRYSKLTKFISRKMGVKSDKRRRRRARSLPRFTPLEECYIIRVQQMKDLFFPSIPANRARERLHYLDDLELDNEEYEEQLSRLSMGATGEEPMLEEDRDEIERYRYTENFLKGNLVWIGRWGEGASVHNHSIEWGNNGRFIMPFEITCDVGDWRRAGRGEVRDGIQGENVDVLRQRWTVDDAWRLNEEGKWEWLGYE